jgi:hypothetical protein
MTSSQLDPRKAWVGFSYEEVIPGYGCVGRTYYWYDPARRLPSVDDHEFRAEHPEIDDREWQRLFYEAFDRGETEFEQHFIAEHGEPPIPVGRWFGPRLPRRPSPPEDE